MSVRLRALLRDDAEPLDEPRDAALRLPAVLLGDNLCAVPGSDSLSPSPSPSQSSGSDSDIVCSPGENPESSASRCDPNSMRLPVMGCRLRVRSSSWSVAGGLGGLLGGVSACALSFHEIGSTFSPSTPCEASPCRSSREESGLLTLLAGGR